MSPIDNIHEFDILIGTILSRDPDRDVDEETDMSTSPDTPGFDIDSPHYLDNQNQYHYKSHGHSTEEGARSETPDSDRGTEHSVLACRIRAELD